MTRRVAVTGLGIVCPVGNNVNDAWSNLVKGHSGIGTISSWQESSLDVTVGGEVKNFNAEDFIEPKKDVKRMGRFIHLGLAASMEAFKMAGFSKRLSDETGNMAGSVIGVGMLGLDVLLQNYDTMKEKGARRVSALFIPGTISNLAPGQIAIKFNLRKDNWTVSSACASGTHAIGEAFKLIKCGLADLMVAGGTESALHPLAAAGFDNMHALCKSKNHDPKSASRPFDKTRDGFVMGEGAGMMVLEEWELAKKRGANIIAEVIGYGSTCDANHITAPSAQGEGAQRAMSEALKSAQISKEQVTYINAHGTGTPLNDKLETEAIKRVFADHAYRLLISSTKSMTGHLLGAAGGIEAVFSVLSIKHGIVPPTINLHEKDPECDLDYVPLVARMANIDVAMSNSFGFGGTNAVLIFRKCR